MQRIKLRKTSWEYDPSITLGPPGGFGTVFLGRSEDGNEVAVKKLHISSASAGNRELVISEELEGELLPNVIPFYDSGVDAETMDYFVVMAKAEYSLQQLIEKGPIPQNDAVKILSDIAQALFETKEIVHRDLKPGNVLYHENKWKLADFGIARFVENSTSLNTLKDCLSPLYAAPEQWRLERATKATDIYALGCISFALLTGNPPFPSGDLCQRHLNEEPPLVKAPPKMQQLISLCLKKNPNARPSVDSVMKQLAGIVANSSLPNNAISVAGATIAAEEAKKEAEMARKSMEEEARRELAKDAISSLELIMEMMFKTVESDAPVARRLANQGGIELGSGRLKIEIPFKYLIKEAFPHSKKNIVCGAVLIVEQDAAYYRGRSANLWFGEFTSGEYRWWEIPYFQWSGSRDEYYPFGISKHSELRDADYAASQVTHTVCFAAAPRPIDGEYTEEFIARWIERLAEASVKRLQRPGSLPEA
jgi:eukaryotic-like serine/threonine-protein kinase